MDDVTEAMIRAIQDAERTMELATNEIIDLKAMLEDLQRENQRLRDRCGRYAQTIMNYERGEL
jgi:predicted RNase H-like nuclease (RuvC/YqgF family)